MDIAQVAKNSGIAASTLRFYEEKGLIRSIGRHGLKRVFGTNVLERLALVSLGRSVGFSLDELALMLGTEGSPKIDRELLATKAEEIDQSIRKLTAMRDGLRHAAVCSAPSHMECPKFRRILGLAAAGAFTTAEHGPGIKPRARKQKAGPPARKQEGVPKARRQKETPTARKRM